MRGESKAEVAGEPEGKDRNGESPLLEHEWYESDLQLAAELGKTLLERNKELETSLRQQQLIIDDNTLEIEHLNKQNGSLKEINESRLKVYEQLEISLQDLEKTNKALSHEAKVDKSNIKSLKSYVESLEKKCEELQKSVDELRAASSRQTLQKRRERRRTLGLGMEFDAAELRRVMSVENGLSHRAGEQHSWDPEKEAEFLRLQQALRELRTQKSREQQLKEELQMETAYLMQENEQLQEQLISFQQREAVMKALQVELQEMEEEFNSHTCCSHCRKRHTPADSNWRKSPTFLDSEVEVEDQPPSSDKCAVVKLRNGGLAYGSQDTLVSAGKVLLVSEPDSTYVPEDEHSSLESSLLSELDTQYRILIEKYEAMVSNRPRMGSPDSRSDSETEDYMDDPERKYHSMGLWAGTEESSSLSSGFSEDVGQVHKAVQTDMRLLATPSNGPSPTKGLASLRAQKNPFENHFNHTPEYKKLFQEIFAVLKKTISYEEAGAAAPAMADTFPPLASREGTPSEDRVTPPNGRSYADVARCRVRGRK